jgi:hypothetical protein
MTTKFEVGKKYLMRNGDWFHVVVIDCPNTHYPIVGWDSDGDVASRTAKGKWYASQGDTSQDLTTVEYQEPEYVWLNVYGDGIGCSFNTKDKSKQVSGNKATGRIKINLTELQGRYDD